MPRHVGHPRLRVRNAGDSWEAMCEMVSRNKNRLHWIFTKAGGTRPSKAKKPAKSYGPPDESEIKPVSRSATKPSLRRFPFEVNPSQMGNKNPPGLDS